MDKRLNIKYCVLTFVLGCGIFLLAALPFALQNGGIFYYYGDFNAQQIPFTISFAGGFSVPDFDFNAGTGMDYLTAYSFYNLFSPFTLIFRLFSEEAAIYLFPYVIALKFGVCVLNAFIFLSRFCKTDSSPAAGALLYAFSGYSMVTFVYHYLDALAFFPLLLTALEAAVTEKRRGFFGITVTLCAFTNYYIFGTEAIFLIIYFLFRLGDGNFRINVRDFFCLAAETVLGLAAAGYVLIPAAAYMLNSPRLDDSFTGIADMLLYETPWRYARILQALFIAPEHQGYTNFFPDFEGYYPAGSRWSSQALYIPMFGISGVYAYMRANGKSRFTKLIAACLIIMLIPVLNSVFSLGSSLYYARWMFAPTLIMVCMTARALEDDPKYFKTGLILNAAAIAVLTVFTIIFPMEKLALWKNGAYYSPVQKWTQLLLTAAGLGLAALLLFKTKRDGQFPQKLIVLIAAAVFAFTESFVLFGMGEERNPEAEIYSNLVRPETEKNEYGKRIVTDSNLENKNIIWGIPSSYTFNSILPKPYDDYCRAAGVYTEDINNDIPSQCLFSVKEAVTYDYFVNDDEYYESSYCALGDVYDFSRRSGNYIIYENRNFIPMGFCYEYCISEEDFLALDEDTRSTLMLKTMVLEDTAAAQEYLDVIDKSGIHPLDDKELAEECRARAEKSADSFKTDGNSYTAEITLDKPGLVFFSVTYDDGFTAYVDGAETDILKANFGFQAVPVPAGKHKVKAVYRSRARDAGAVCSAAGAAGLIIYIGTVLSMKKHSIKNAQKFD